MTNPPTNLPTLPVAFALSALPALIPAAAFLIPLFWKRQTQQFTIVVTPEYAGSPQAAATRKRYLATMLLLAAAGFAGLAVSFSIPLPWLTAATPLVEMLGILLTWAWAWKRTLPHRVPHPIVRTASLNPRPQDSVIWWLSTLTAWIPLSIAAAFLATHWSQIPARFPTHWGFNGQPNGWTMRSPAGVFWPLAMGAGLVAFMAFLGHVIARFSPTLASAALRRMTLNILRAVCWLMAFLFAGVGLLPLTADANKVILWLAPCAGFVILAIVVYGIATVMRDKNFDALQNATAEQYWKWGILYYNPADAALFVPKRLGYGFTFNFARPAAWMMILLVLAVAMVPVALSIASRSR